MKEINVYYQPRQAFVPFHQREKRWACLVVHRRGGKTVACINDLHTRALYTQKKNARYAYIAPFYRQAKDVAWMYLKEATRDSAVKVKESELSVELFNGAKITLYGADNPNSLRGLYLDGVVLDEYGDCRPSLWGEVVLPTLADRHGWAVFIGTARGKNHFYEIRELARKNPQEWYFLELKASESGILPASELDAMRSVQTEEQYAREMECSFEASVIGTYYAKLIGEMERGHINDPAAKPQITIVPYDPDFEVSVAQDLGYTDSTAMWFWQQRPGGLAMIDYEEHHGEKLDFYFDLLRSKGYRYNAIWLPHDAKAANLQTGRSTVEQYLSQRAYDPKKGDLVQEFPVRIAPKLDLQHGIDAVRYILQFCYIDKEKCHDGIEALRAYRRGYNEVTKAFTDAPVHDWSSNGADAMRYFALVAREFVQPKSVQDVLREAVGPAHYNFSLDQLFADNERGRGIRSRTRI